MPFCSIVRAAFRKGNAVDRQEGKKCVDAQVRSSTRPQFHVVRKALLDAANMRSTSNTVLSSVR